MAHGTEELNDIDDEHSAHPRARALALQKVLCIQRRAAEGAKLQHEQSESRSISSGQWQQRNWDNSEKIPPRYDSNATEQQ